MVVHMGVHRLSGWGHDMALVQLTTHTLRAKWGPLTGGNEGCSMDADDSEAAVACDQISGRPAASKTGLEHTWKPPPHLAAPSPQLTPSHAAPLPLSVGWRSSPCSPPLTPAS